MSRPTIRPAQKEPSHDPDDPACIYWSGDYSWRRVTPHCPRCVVVRSANLPTVRVESDLLGATQPPRVHRAVMYTPLVALAVIAVALLISNWRIS
jgi:hypothetical protein